AGVGRARRPVHQRRTHHRLGTPQTAGRTVGHRDRGRRRIPHRHATRTARVSASTGARAPGMSARLKLTLSYAGFLMLAGVLLLATVWVFLLRYVPDRAIIARGFIPNRSDLLDAFAPRAAAVLAFLLVFGLVGGWILAGRL